MQPQTSMDIHGDVLSTTFYYYSTCSVKGCYIYIYVSMSFHHPTSGHPSHPWRCWNPFKGSHVVKIAVSNHKKNTQVSRHVQCWTATFSMIRGRVRNHPPAFHLSQSTGWLQALYSAGGALPRDGSRTERAKIDFTCPALMQETLSEAVGFLRGGLQGEGVTGEP